jgi:hypothetical protein
MIGCSESFQQIVDRVAQEIVVAVKVFRVNDDNCNRWVIHNGRLKELFPLPIETRMEYLHFLYSNWFMQEPPTSMCPAPQKAPVSKNATRLPTNLEDDGLCASPFKDTGALTKRPDHGLWFGTTRFSGIERELCTGCGPQTTSIPRVARIGVRVLAPYGELPKEVFTGDIFYEASDTVADLIRSIKQVAVVKNEIILVDVAIAHPTFGGHSLVDSVKKWQMENNLDYVTFATKSWHRI